MANADLELGSLLSQACDDVLCMTSLLNEETEAVAAGDVQAVMRMAPQKNDVAARVASGFAAIDGRMDAIAAGHMTELRALSVLQAELATAAERNMTAVASGRAAASAAIAMLVPREPADDALGVYGRNGILRGQASPTALDIRF